MIVICMLVVWPTLVGDQHVNPVCDKVVECVILLRLSISLLFVIFSSWLGSVCVHVRGSIGCGVQPTMLVLFELCFVNVKPSLFVGMSAACSHDVCRRCSRWNVR